MAEAALYSAGVSLRVEDLEEFGAWQSVVGMQGMLAKHADVANVQPGGGDVHGLQWVVERAAGIGSEKCNTMRVGEYNVLRQQRHEALRRPNDGESDIHMARNEDPYNVKHQETDVMPPC